MEEDRKRFIAAGLDDYIAKPIKANQLIGKVQERVLGTKNEVVDIENHSSNLKILNKEKLEMISKIQYMILKDLL